MEEIVMKGMDRIVDLHQDYGYHGVAFRISEFKSMVLDQKKVNLYIMYHGEPVEFKFGSLSDAQCFYIGAFKQIEIAYQDYVMDKEK